MQEAPIVSIRGLRIANFSSPHPFDFVTGERLSACDEERARTLVLHAHEATKETIVNGITITDISLTYTSSALVLEELDRLMARDDIDIILVPLPMLLDLRGSRYMRKVRGIRLSDRVSKAIYTDRFCI